MAMLYIISTRENAQTKYIAEFARSNKIKCKLLTPDDESTNITIEEKRVLINNKPIGKKDIVYSVGLGAEYLTIPNPETFNNWSVFQDFHSGDDQKRSHLLSLLSHLETLNKGSVINNPINSFDFSSQIYSLELLKRNGIKTPEYLFTNSFEFLQKSSLYKNSDILLWSYPTVNSPLKPIRKSKISSLFDSNSELPFLIMEAKQGLAIRLWFYRSEPLMGTWLLPPEFESNETRLEKFIFIDINDKMKDLGKHIGNDIPAEFYEIRGIVDDESGELFVQAIDCDPNFIYLPKNYRNILVSRLLGKFFEIHAPTIPAEEDRESIYLTRILESQWEVHKLEGNNG
jgi:hypothetical protein